MRRNKGQIISHTQAFWYISDRVRKTETRGLQEYLRLDESVSVWEKTTYRYFDILDALSESKDTLQAALPKLHTDLKIGDELNHVLVVIDAKTYPVLQAMKHQVTKSTLKSSEQDKKKVTICLNNTIASHRRRSDACRRYLI